MESNDQKWNGMEEMKGGKSLRKTYSPTQGNIPNKPTTQADHHKPFARCFPFKVLPSEE